MKGYITTKEMSERVGLTLQRLHQLIKMGEIKGEKIGRDWLIEEKYVDIILSRPEKRGNYDRKKAA